MIPHHIRFIPASPRFYSSIISPSSAKLGAKSYRTISLSAGPARTGNEPNPTSILHTKHLSKITGYYILASNLDTKYAVHEDRHGTRIG